MWKKGTTVFLSVLGSVLLSGTAFFSFFTTPSLADSDAVLSSVYCKPNPFSRARDVYTTINYALPNGAAELDIRIYTPEGELVWSSVIPAGESVGSSLEWTGINDRGKSVAPGGYLCKVLAIPPGGGSRQSKTIRIGVLP